MAARTTQSLRFEPAGAGGPRATVLDSREGKPQHFRMRFELLAVTFLVLCACASAERARTWTEETTGKKIEGTLADKRSDNSAVQLKLTTGKTVWLKVERLVKADREYIARWIPADDHVTLRVLKISRGSRTLTVTAKAGTKKMKVLAYALDYSPQLRTTKWIEAGDQVSFDFTAGKRYRVDAFHGSELVDQESWDRKTGL